MRYTTASELDKQETDQLLGRRMALTQRLQMRQSQALVMTPQLMQAIKLLQLSNLDLAAYVEGELEKNPLLERAAEGEPGVIDGAAEPVAPEFSGDGDGRGDGRRRRPDRREPGDQPQRDRGAARHRSRKRVSRRRRRSRARAPARTRRRPIRTGPASAAAAARTATTISKPSCRPSRRSPIIWPSSLSLAIADPVRRMIGQYLIDLVDEAGYLTGDLASVAEKLGAPLDGGRGACSAIVQGFDPPGVCARNLTECLAIQLKERNRFDPAMAALVGRLDLLAKRDLAGAAAHLRRRRRGPRRHDRRDPQAQSEARPRLRLRRMVQPIVPDVFVRAGPDGGLHRRAQLRHAAESAGQPALPRRAVEERARPTATRPISPNTCRPRPG